MEPKGAAAGDEPATGWATLAPGRSRHRDKARARLAPRQRGIAARSSPLPSDDAGIVVRATWTLSARSSSTGCRLCQVTRSWSGSHPPIPSTRSRSSRLTAGCEGWYANVAHPAQLDDRRDAAAAGLARPLSRSGRACRTDRLDCARRRRTARFRAGNDADPELLCGAFWTPSRS